MIVRQLFNLGAIPKNQIEDIMRILGIYDIFEDDLAGIDQQLVDKFGFMLTVGYFDPYADERNKSKRLEEIDEHSDQ